MKITPLQFNYKLFTVYSSVQFLLSFFLVYIIESFIKKYVLVVNSFLLIFVPILSTLFMFWHIKKDIPKYEIKTTKLEEIEKIVKEFERIEKISVIKSLIPKNTIIAATSLYSPIDYFRQRSKGYLILDVELTTSEGMKILEPILYHEIGHIVLNHHKGKLFLNEKIYKRILLILSVTLSFITNTIFIILILDIICIVLIQILKSYQDILLEAEADHFITRYYKGNLEDYYMSCKRPTSYAFLPQKANNLIIDEFQ